MIVWFVTVAVVIVLGGVAAVAAGLGGELAPREDAPAWRVPEAELTPADLRRVRFPSALRGYRASEVDALLDRLASEWEQRLTGAGGASAGERSPQ